MSPRSAAAAAAAVAVLAAPAAAAAPACRLVVDPKDDAHVAGAGPGRPGIDIVSADVATGRYEQVAVVRLASLRPDDALRLGTFYRITWEAAGLLQYVELVRYAGGEQVARFEPNGHDQSSLDHYPPKVTIDERAGTITFAVPRSKNPALARKGATFTAFHVTADASVNYLVPPHTPLHSSTTVPLGGDEATSARRYADRARSCVRAR